MIISRTPFRISFFGGGTDYPAWYRTHGGQVLATTIDKYCYLTCRYLPPFFEHRTSVTYSKIENVNSIDEISHPAVRHILQYLNIVRGLAVKHDADLPARSGMGSSSAFTVGLLHALRALQGRMTPKPELAREAIYVEQQLLQETVGSQDQVLAAVGGFNHIVFNPSGEIVVRPITIPPARLAELQGHLLLFYTGIARTASTVAASYSLTEREAELKILRRMVGDSISILASERDIRAFGELLHEAWLAKQKFSPAVSNGDIGEIYQTARTAGAIGGKILGAGGGGFMLLFAPPVAQPAIRRALDGLIHVPFQFESSGSQIIFYDPGVDYSNAERVRANQRLRAFREVIPTS